jgi:hypothetical protein
MGNWNRDNCLIGGGDSCNANATPRAFGEGEGEGDAVSRLSRSEQKASLA